MLVIFIIVIVAAIVLLIYSMANNSDMDSFCNGMLFVIGVILALILGVIMLCKPLPQAIDVYRGRTTLEITYRNSIAIDSVVVFRNIEE